MKPLEVKLMKMGGAGDDGSDDDEDGLEEDSESELEEEDPVIHVED